MKTADYIYYVKLRLFHLIQPLKLKIITFLFFQIFSGSGIMLKASVDDTISHWSLLMAERLMDNPSIAAGPNLQSYVFATGMKGLRELFEVTGDSVYYHYISDIVDDNLSEYEDLPGISVPDMDFINGASLIEFMYSRTGDARYIPAIDSTLKYLYAMPRTGDGGIYHKGGRSYYRLQLDDLYMIGPFLAEYGVLFDKPEVYQDAVKQALLFKKYMRDTVTGLMYHAWYDGTMGETSGCTPYFWGRGIGWVAMGLADMLDFLPESYAGRDSIIDMFQDLCKAISEVQDPERYVWWQVLDQPAASGNYTESSASCMFVYAIAKGIRLGYLDNSFLSCIENGIQGIVNYFLDIVDENTINITHLCPGQGPSFILSQYFLGQSQNGHAVGPFIGAMLETSEQHIYPAGINEDLINKDLVLFNYPNPFSGETMINLTMPDTKTITLDVYNMLGQKVKEIFKGVMTEGIHTFTFDATTLQSGIYLCRLKTGNNISFKSMILIR